jgi:hypothetical protein
MARLPVRGPAVRDLALPLPPSRMPWWRAGRPLKRWRYVGVYTPEALLCVGEARIGPVPQRWWAVATPDGGLLERTTFGRGGVRIAGSSVAVRAKGVEIELRLEESRGVEAVSPVADGQAYAWTRKQACVPVRGRVEIAGRRLAIQGDVGFVDDSAGYHARHTEWRWSAGVGRAVDGRAVGWNLVAGIHDDPFASERTIWVDGDPRSVGPVTFADDLSRVDGNDVSLAFEEWSTRAHSTNALLLRSRYRQPFGELSGRLCDLTLASGYGVMEHHDAWW